MYNRRIFELIILGLWLFVAIIITIDYNIKISDTVKLPSYSLVLQPNNEIEIKKISVINGNSFDLILKDQNKSRIIVSLPISASQEAKQKVIDLLSDSTSPKVILLNKKKDGKWIADLKFFFKEKEISLKDWLSTNNLVEE